MKDKEMLIEMAELYAKRKHAKQMYGEYPYTYHLEMVVMILKLHQINDADIIAAGWLHDVVEDQNIPKEALIEVFGERVFKLVRAVTDPQNLPNRKEKKRAVYKKLQEYPEAIPVKLADRIANVMMSQFNRPDKFEMYRKEHDGFAEALFKHSDVKYNPMWTHLRNLTEK